MVQESDAITVEMESAKSETNPTGENFYCFEFVPQGTAVEAVAEAKAEAAPKVVKVIKNGKLYIGNYNVAGQQVK